ncbi:MAG TPA: glycosyltransferase family 2 protein [Anaeromyxobacteraceae bacterium]|nr:glycosyltransferase family 2 protein [Anaeromyxobacteraceae bacterium]
MIELSGVVITFNEARNLERCLASLRPVCDELLVVDSGSTDRTRELAEACGARVLVRPFDGFTAQKAFAAAQAAHDHVLSLDADEWLSPALAVSIAAAKADWRCDGYDFNRLNLYAGRPVRSCGWYPDAKIRLWDRRRGAWGGGLVHETVSLVPGASQGHLEGDLLHAAHQEAGQLLAKVQAYSALWARENAGRPVSAAAVFGKGVAAFVRSYLLKGGILDGWPGLVISVTNANHAFYKYARLLEANRAARAAGLAGREGQG